MSQNFSDFNVGVVKPVECVKEGWALIKDRYWLFFGITVLGVLIGGTVPIVLMGPMMVGIYLCLFRKMRNEPIEFGTLFKGFDYFVQGLVASAIQMIPMIIVIAPMTIIFLVMIMTSMPRGGRMSQSESSEFVFKILGMELVFVAIIIAVGLVVHIFFMFAFPLIADRNLSGMDAVKLSIKAGKANFGGVILLLLLNAAMGIVAALCCYLPVFFLMPVTMASYAVAYRRVFPEITPVLTAPPPPPASWAT